MTAARPLPLSYESPRPGAGGTDVPVGRALWLDVFRGFTMVCLVAEGFGLTRFTEHPTLAPVARQFEHVRWEGLAAWDLVQPFFMFIVGAAMPYSFGRRWAAGESWARSLLHVLKRCALLIGWGLLARSIQRERPNLDLINVLAQIAFTYLVAFLVLRRSIRVQAAVAGGLLLAHWAFYQFWRPDPAVVGAWVWPDPPAAHNPGTYLDWLVLGKNWYNGYATINAVSSAANTIAGVIAAEYLLNERGRGRRLLVVLVAAVVLVLAGLGLSPWVPVIKKIWTASFALVSIGLTLAALLAFYLAAARWPGSLLWYPFVVAGANSIFLYLLHEIFHGFLHEKVVGVFTRGIIGESTVWGGLLTDWMVLLLELSVAFWLYRRRIFFKL